MSVNLSQLPSDLPRPTDDGAAAHLVGVCLPEVLLRATDGTLVNVGTLKGRFVIYIYPMTGRPDVALPVVWDGIPGARGCTPQSCSFRDHYGELRELETGVFGLSAQTSEYQREARDRLHLPFQLLSDSALELKSMLRLPTFTAAGMELFKRLTLITEDGTIRKVFYPVFPPDQNADDVLAWLHSRAQQGAPADVSASGEIKGVGSLSLRTNFTARGGHHDREVSVVHCLNVPDYERRF